MLSKQEAVGSNPGSRSLSKVPNDQFQTMVFTHFVCKVAHDAKFCNALCKCNWSHLLRASFFFGFGFLFFIYLFIYFLLLSVPSVTRLAPVYYDGYETLRVLHGPRYDPHLSKIDGFWLVLRWLRGTVCITIVT